MAFLLGRGKLSVAAGVLAVSALAAAGPCDIYAAGNTPCIAAHSTTRALYDTYAGPLYHIKRGSDGAEIDIFPRDTGGIANGLAQDDFCSRTTCLITVICDQSGRQNHLTRAPAGGFDGPDVDGSNNLASAIGAPVKLNGRKTYGVFVAPGTGYRNNVVNGSAVGDEPQGTYAVLDGTHFNDCCCFDYGNAETNSLDTGNGHMEALYFGAGDGSGRGTGAGNGPWIMADLENGLFSGFDPVDNPGDPSITSRFVTAVIKGAPGRWAIRGGDSTKPVALSTFYNGSRPAIDGYNPMSKEGAIILGIGGDNSNGAQGTFYEGAMTAGYPSDATEDAVQANIRAARYTTTSLLTGPAIALNSTVSFRITTDNSDSSTKQRANWVVRIGLANDGCYSFESVDTPGSFIRHSAYRLQLNINDSSKLFAEDATFCLQAGFNGQGSSIRSWSYPARYLRHFGDGVYLSSNGGVFDFDAAQSYTTDASWTISSALS